MKEYIEKFDELMKCRKKESDYTLFDSAFKDMFEWCCKNYPDAAKKILDKLSGMNWKQYVTKEEAEKVYQTMQPAPKWNHSQFLSHLESLKLEKDEDGVFNCYALWLVCSMIYSDDAATLALFTFSRNRADEVDDREMLPLIHALALNKLKDKDGKFDVRKYFCL